VIRTPYYLIDEGRLAKNLAVVDHVRATSGAHAVLALKCFATWGVFDLMRGHLDGTTSSSPYEARLGREELGGEVHAYGVGFTADDIAAVAGIADKVIFNSLSQLARFAGDVGSAAIGVRVNPGVSHSDFDLADPARRHSRLGVVDADSLRAVVPSISGLMFHFNCENEDFEGLAAQGVAGAVVGQRQAGLAGAAQVEVLGEPVLPEAARVVAHERPPARPARSARASHPSK